MKPKPIDIHLYEKERQMADVIYDRPSAYKSGAIVRMYKEMGGRYMGGEKKDGDLNRWFNEQWMDVNPFKTSSSYPVYRPTKKVSKKTPLTVYEIDPKDLIKKSKKKQKLKGDKLDPFKPKGKG